VRIPRIVINGPKDRVATWVMLVPTMPTIAMLKRIYRMIGIILPRMIARLKSFSWP